MTASGRSCGSFAATREAPSNANVDDHERSIILFSFFLSFSPNVAFSRETGWRGLCPAQTVTDRIVGYNAWFGVPTLTLFMITNPPKMK